MPSALTRPTPRLARLSPVAAVATLHLIGGVLAAVAIGHGTHALPVAAGLAAYLLGVRHAFDADHILAIDNTTRYLRSQHQPARSVGFWFSLGHSTVVLLACVLLGVGWRLSETGASVTSVWGPAVAGTFLVGLAAVNARVMLALWRARHRPDEVARRLASRGFMTRVLGSRWTLHRPRQMYLVGFLFGLGFDTATSVGLLLLAAGGQQSALTWAAYLALPCLFAAGMTLFDSLDGAVMNRAYGWADSDARRLGYNLVVTGVSAVAALVVGALVLHDLLNTLA